VSVSISLDSEIVGELASNKGWGDACRWIDGLGVEHYEELVHLREYGWSQHLDELAAQLAKAMEEHAPKDLVRDTVSRLLTFARNPEGAEVMTVNDGVAPDGGERDEKSADWTELMREFT
jgi:hypothetical protein